ncbi:MAG: hypothetical protein RQ885_08595 [Desulfurococcales archaeon]|jgi:hypothetical protein|nr:hypothetical protein [Desulfurococcales archaeon]
MVFLKELNYAINLLRLRPNSLDDLLHLHKALYKAMLKKLAFSGKVMVETYIKRPIVVKHWMVLILSLDLAQVISTTLF